MIFLEDAVVILNLLEERNSNAPQGSLKWVPRRSAAAGAVCKKRSLPQHNSPQASLVAENFVAIVRSH